MNKSRIKNKIQTIINNPDIYPSESIEPLQQSNVSIQNEINSLKKSLKKRIIGTKITEGQINILNEEISELEISIFRIRTEIKEIAENIIEIVKVEEKCIITQNISPNDCKVAAIKNSEKRAVELGGQSLIKSITEMVNHKITRDEITREIKAKIIKKEIKILFDRNKGDFGEYTITLIAAIKNISQSKPDPQIDKEKREYTEKFEEPETDFEPTITDLEIQVYFYPGLIAGMLADPNCDCSGSLIGFSLGSRGKFSIGISKLKISIKWKREENSSDELVEIDFEGESTNLEFMFYPSGENILNWGLFWFIFYFKD